MSKEPASDDAIDRSTAAGDYARTEGSDGQLLGTDDCIRLRGVRVHNLKNIDLDIPREKLVVITGPSGSGKSSLAFDALVAEGQRQYIESLSVYARQFFTQMERPDIDLIEGLQPTVAIDQRAGSQNPRSTVATVTEIHDYLRLLMARLGEATCPACGAAIRPQSPEEIQAELLALPSNTKVMLLAPLVRGRKGQHKEVFAEIRKAGLLRARVDGDVVDVEQPPDLEPRKNHTIEAVVDRIVIREGIGDRLAESIQLTLAHGEGTLVASYQARDKGNSGSENSRKQQAAGETWRDELFSTLNACPECKTSFEEIEPRTFSFNSPYGACPVCEGLGTRVEFDQELVLADPALSLGNGAVAAWKGASQAAIERYKQSVEPFLARERIAWDTALAEWKPAAIERFWRGDGNFAGLVTLLEKEYVTATKPHTRERLETFRDEVTCAACGGARLRPEARSVRFAGKAIHEIGRLSVGDAARFFAAIEVHADDAPIYEPIAAEIKKRLHFLVRLGLDYVTLDRAADTLSGGELQRVRLATGIGSGLTSVCYVLDEPSIGLHPRDNDRLIASLRDLQEQGNTVIVVEHDEATMRAADYLIDIGPGAGIHGGEIVGIATPDEVQRNAASITGRYLAGELSIPVPSARRKSAKTRSITLEGVTTNNLKNVEVRFPLGVFTCVTGVSGSGKSSLLNATFARVVKRRLMGMGAKPGPHTSLRGVTQIDKFVEVDQSPIGRTPRSNPATYTGLFDEIRKVFAGTREARQRGYKSGRFSFNTKGGRCEECQGQGVKRIEMNFLPDLFLTCPVCGGKRFNQQTLDVKYKERSIADVLEMSVDEAIPFFESFTTPSRILASLAEVGLGYLALGQSSTTLSGGEAQRIKLATELARVETGNTLYLLDEPTTGLHFDDVRRLLAVLGRLVDLGNTVIVIEHNLDVIKTADWIIDLGPEGGAAGGYVVATGTPEEVAAVSGNHTGAALGGCCGRVQGSGFRASAECGIPAAAGRLSAE